MCLRLYAFFAPPDPRRRILLPRVLPGETRRLLKESFHLRGAGTGCGSWRTCTAMDIVVLLSQARHVCMYHHFEERQLPKAVLKSRKTSSENSATRYRPRIPKTPRTDCRCCHLVSLSFWGFGFAGLHACDVHTYIRYIYIYTHIYIYIYIYIFIYLFMYRGVVVFATLDTILLLLGFGVLATSALPPNMFCSGRGWPVHDGIFRFLVANQYLLLLGLGVCNWACYTLSSIVQ